jgi:hypothetical protein
MAKKTKSASESVKVTFGVRRKGKHSKSLGPKDSPSSKYRGQGR